MADERVWQIFDQAADLPAERRQAFLASACGDDAALHAEVASLLAADAGPGDEGFLHSPLVRQPALADTRPGPQHSEAPPWLPRQVGRYRILRLVGEGGMGSVYEAEQDNPRRSVALKMIRPGLVSPGLAARFARETEVLGRLQHPGIAQIYDAGVTDGGQPYFAMEFIHGERLDVHARQRRLDAAARLALLAKICDAVQHAHDKGVIHRDLKPANVLIDEAGQPKVLDFGVARATNAGFQSSADRTGTGELIGTLGYMSPEQVTADPASLDHRSDVYALGVLLYESLADRLPYHLEQLPLPEIARVILEQEPSKLGSIDSRWRGDIETIVAKALEKDKGRRYASAAALAADIRRYLNHEPILARRPSVVYQFRKFVRRNKALVGAGAGVLAALVIGFTFTLFYAFGEAAQRRQAVAYARLADDERLQALREAYRARIAAAAAALQANDVTEAARQLNLAPGSLREWEWRHLRSRLDESSADFKPPAGGKLALIASPDGPLLLSSTSTELRLADTNGRERFILPAPGNCSDFSLSLTPLGPRICAIGPQDTSIRDERGNVIRTLPTLVRIHLGPDPNRTALVSFNDARTASWFTLIDVPSGRELARFVGHAEQIYSLAFSPDGTRIASGSEDGTARVWEAASGREIAVCRGHSFKVLWVSFHPDGKRLVTASADGTVRQWDPATGREVEPAYEGHAGEVFRAIYSPDGQRIASGGSDRTIRLWHATGRRDAARSPR